MKVATLAFVAVMMCVGAALADYGYGSYGAGGAGGAGYSFMPVTPGAGGFGDQSFLYLIGFLFLFMLLINGNLFNTTSSTSTTPITIVQG